jgi:hypothetical protein
MEKLIQLFLHHWVIIVCLFGMGITFGMIIGAYVYQWNVNRVLNKKLRKAASDLYDEDKF